MTRPKPLRVAVLGDVHGHLALAFTLLRRWERETSRTLDLILQVGDMGAFPPPYRLDKSTKRFAERDPDELGFSVFHAGEEEAARYLAPDAPEASRVDADMVFIRGNHEDFVFLDEASSGADAPVPVDAFGRIHHLRNGLRWTFSRRGIDLHIAALGGVSSDGVPGCEPEHYTASDVRALRKLDERVDVLLSHEPPFDAGRAISARYANQGSRDVGTLIRALKPRYHFAGHWHEPGARLDAPDWTASHQLNAVNFLKPTRLNPRCIGVLSWLSPDEHSWEWLEAPWLLEYARSTWRVVG